VKLRRKHMWEGVIIRVGRASKFSELPTQCKRILARRSVVLKRWCVLGAVLLWGSVIGLGICLAVAEPTTSLVWAWVLFGIAGAAFLVGAAPALLKLRTVPQLYLIDYITKLMK